MIPVMLALSSLSPSPSLSLNFIKRYICRLPPEENLPTKNTATAKKVTFQTPLWDPQTHRILSPSMNIKLEACFAQEDTIGLENPHQKKGN